MPIASVITATVVKPGERHRPRPVDVLASDRRIPELASCGISRLMRTHACAKIPRGQQLEVRLEFALGVLVETPPAEESTNAYRDRRDG
jgi:hypothetical protein